MKRPPEIPKFQKAIRQSNKGRGVSQYSAKIKQGTEGDEGALSWIEERKIRKARIERARNAASRKLLAEGNKGVRLQVEQRKLKKAEGSRARYAATKNRAAEGGSDRGQSGEESTVNVPR